MVSPLLARILSLTTASCADDFLFFFSYARVSGNAGAAPLPGRISSRSPAATLPPGRPHAVCAVRPSWRPQRRAPSAAQLRPLPLLSGLPTQPFAVCPGRDASAYPVAPLLRAAGSTQSFITTGWATGSGSSSTLRCIASDSLNRRRCRLP